MRLLICPFNHSGLPGVSHTGLHISSLNTAKVLKNAGVDVLMFPIKHVGDLTALIAKHNPTHVVTCAFWMPLNDIQTVLLANPYIQFAINCHSNIAFLQTEPNGLKMARGLVDIELSNFNFNLSGNSRGFCSSVESSWEAPCAYLPNLYFVDGTVREFRPHWNGGTLRIGCFGALRPLKNPTVSAFAALSIANNLGTNLEFSVNVGRNDGWGEQTLKAVREIMRDLPNVKLIELPWQDWPNHRRSVRHQHLLLQPSFTESYNIVTADGAAEGIPSVVSAAVEWSPDWWKGNPDDAVEIGRIGRALLSDQSTGRDGLHALQRANGAGVLAWKLWLGVA